jgi:hypothetical protein
VRKAGRAQSGSCAKRVVRKAGRAQSGSCAKRGARKEGRAQRVTHEVGLCFEARVTLSASLRLDSLRFASRSSARSAPLSPQRGPILPGGSDAAPPQDPPTGAVWGARRVSVIASHVGNRAGPRSLVAGARCPSRAPAGLVTWTGSLLAECERSSLGRALLARMANRPSPERSCLGFPRGTARNGGPHGLLLGGSAGGAASLPPGAIGPLCGGSGAERAKRVEAERSAQGHPSLETQTNPVRHP